MGERHTATDFRHVSLETVLDSIPDPVLLADATTGEIIETNRAAGDLFDCRPGALVGRQWAECCPSANREQFRSLIENFPEDDRIDRFESGEPIRIETFAGEQRPVEMSLQRIFDGGDPLLFCLCRDVSERIEREQTLRATVARLEALFEASPVPMAVLDTDGIVQRWNRTAECAFGWSTTDVTGQPYPLFESETVFAEVLGRLHDGELIIGMETTHQGKDGSIADVELYAQPLFENGSLSSIIISAIDITDLKQREQHLGVLHRIMRHSLRNKLNVIYASGERIADSEHSEHIERLLGATEELIGLSERAQQIDSDLHCVENLTPVGLDSLLCKLREDVQKTHPDATITLANNTSSAPVPHLSRTVFEELIDHVIRHSESQSPTVSIEASVDRRIAVDVTVEHFTLTEGERAFIQRDEPATLLHGTRLCLAHADILVTELGGQLSGMETGAETTLCVELPRSDCGRV